MVGARSRDYKPVSGVPHNLYRDYLYVRNLQPVQSGEVTEPAAYFIVGTPQEVGTFPVTYTIVDSNGDTATVEFTITVFGPETGTIYKRRPSHCARRR